MKSDNLALRYALLACLTHTVFIAVCAVPGVRVAPVVSGDAVTYVVPAQNLLLHGVFSREVTPPYLWEPYRTPGYPVLIALSMRLFGSEGFTLYVAVLTAALAAWSAVRLVEDWGGNGLARHLAGIAVAFLPNSLGLSAMLLTDAVFGHLFLFWFFLLYHGLAQFSRKHLIGATGVLWVLQFLKPTLNVAVLLVAGISLLVPEARRQLLAVAILVIAALIVPFYFAERNWEDNGIFTPTFLGVETVREYLQVRYLSEQSGVDVDLITSQVRAADRAAAEESTLPASIYGRLYRVKEEAVGRFIRQEPLSALRLMTTEMVWQLAAPQEFAFTVFWGDLPAWIRAIGSLLTLALWAGAAFGAWNLGRAGNWQAGAAFAGILVFFLVSGSISHFVGARLRFPADLVGIPLMAVGVGSVAKLWTLAI